MALTFTARLEQAELAALVDSLLPLAVDLSSADEEPGRRWIRIEKPHHLDFEKDRGLRIKTSAKVRWTAAGLAIPGTLNEVDILVRPVVTIDATGPKLVFRPTFENTDFKLLPSFVDHAIAARINAALEEQGDKLAWHFGEALRRIVPLPENLDPPLALHIEAAGAGVEIEADAFVLRIEMAMRFERHEAPAGDAEKTPPGP